MVGRTTVGSNLLKGKHKFIPIDLTKEKWEIELPSDIDCIVHLAQAQNYNVFPENATEITAVNVNSSIRLAKFAAQTNVKKFIYASSGSIYKPSKNPLKESSQKIPTSYYGASKLSAEILLDQFKTFFVITKMRFFTVYGEKAKKGLVKTLIDRVMQNEEIELPQGRGLITNPTYVSDAINSIIKSIASKESININIAGKEAISIKDMATIIGEKLGKSPNFISTDEDTNDFIANTSKMKSFLDIAETIPFNEGVDFVLENHDHETPTNIAKGTI